MDIQNLRKKFYEFAGIEQAAIVIVMPCLSQEISGNPPFVKSPLTNVNYPLCYAINPFIFSMIEGTSS